ncbi:MAG: cupin domain-containing protein [Candidatus Omnitrophica bacterium]|nr:cupin domain-containing protein [Candidatus Omnitrophota bacterium]
MRKYFCGSNGLFVGLLIGMLTGCGTLPVDNRPQKTANGKLTRETKVYQLSKSCASWDGALLPAYPQGRPEITVLRIVIPAGATLERHKHPVINAGVLLKGELTVQTENGETLYLKAEESLVEVVDTWHYGKNEGSESAEIIVFYAGIDGAPITVHEPD